MAEKAATTEKRRTGGGWNKKDVMEHVRNGTYRPGLHGPLPGRVMDLPKKPPGMVPEATMDGQYRWARNAADEQAIRNGCIFNERLAVHAVDFFEKYLCHSKGQWAGQPFTLTDWERNELIYPLFGWVKPDGTRRFKRTYIECPKKIGKSTLASGIGLYMLVADEEPGAEIWSTGADKDQAKIVHREAMRMVEASPKLSAALKVNHSNSYITYGATNSFYCAVSAEPRGKQGANLHCAIIDELHEWYGDELWNRLRYAIRARLQPLIFVITNAGDDLQSVCYRQHEKAVGVLNGSIFDDEYFALICSATQKEAEEEIENVKNGATELPVARKCTPGLGIIIKEQALVADIRDAIQTPSELPNLLRLTYGVWNTGVDLWLRTTDWKSCYEEYTADDCIDWQTMGGLDMSKTGDMTALVLMFRDPEEIDLYRQLAWFWMPEKTIEERQHLIDYRAWVQSGHLRIGGQKAIDTSLVEGQIKEICEGFVVEQLAYDPMYVSESRLAELLPDTECIAFPQTIMQFAGPTSEYERLILGGRLHHNGNPILTWQAGNCTVKTDMNKNKRPVKPKPGDVRTIDGVVAGIMTLRLHMANDYGQSDYEESGTMYGVYEE